MLWTTVALITTLLPQLLLSEKCHFVVNSSITLQHAINLSLLQECNGDVQIELPSGKHIITSQTLFSAKMNAIEFVGVDNDVNVICDYDLRSNYTWYFVSLYSVRVTGINFNNCPRPLRMDSISNVTIQKCSFRLDACSTVCPHVHKANNKVCPNKSGVISRNQ